MNILSVNFNHDGAGAIISNGKLAGFVNTERFSRIKKHPGIRKEDLDNLLQQAGLTLQDIDHVCLCNLHVMDSDDIPNTYGTNLKETWFEFWINQTLDKVIIQERQFPCTVNPAHHMLHNALAYYTSPFNEGVCFSWDPGGYAAHIGAGNKMREVENFKIRFNASNWYSTAATDIFGTGIFGAGKVMGLAPYGKPVDDNQAYLQQINRVHDLLEFSQENHKYVYENGKPLNAALAYNVQVVMENELIEIFDKLYDVCVHQDIEPNICLGGGGALNSVANQIAFKNSKFKNIYIHPACGDDGTAIGAGLWFWHDQLNNKRQSFDTKEVMYSVKNYDHVVEQALALPQYKNRLIVEKTEDYIDRTAELLKEGKIIGWFQGASEIGPRALGNRSILADPRSGKMKDILNARVKFREGFRPFAPAVLNEHGQEWFGLVDSPFMLRVCQVLKNEIPAVTHVDDTARIQTVNADDNQNFYNLIKSFYEKTNVPVLINTSFNIKGEPIVETPDDAINSFLNSQIDHLIFKDMVISKQRQPAASQQQVHQNEVAVIDL
jgi:carbamoyltransferase